MSLEQHNKNNLEIYSNPSLLVASGDILRLENWDHIL